MGSLVVAPGSRAQAHQSWHMGLAVLHGTWDLPESGIEPMALALAGGFLTTQPVGKPPHLICQTTAHTHVFKTFVVGQQGRSKAYKTLGVKDTTTNVHKIYSDWMKTASFSKFQNIRR